MKGRNLLIFEFDALADFAITSMELDDEELVVDILIEQTQELFGRGNFLNRRDAGSIGWSFLEVTLGWRSAFETDIGDGRGEITLTNCERR